ncbi:MAG: hypothetical protein AB8B58_15040 [Roseobacter sp.]
MRALCLALMLAVPAPLSAQTAAEAAAQNMQLAAELCLRNYRTPQTLGQAFSSAGFTLGPSALAAGVTDFTAPGITGAFQTGYCYTQSDMVPLPMAEAIGRAVADRLFPGLVHDGAPEHVAGTPLKPCEGLQVFAPQNLIAISYAAAGNSGECISDGTSSIIIQM